MWVACERQLRCLHESRFVKVFRSLFPLVRIRQLRNWVQPSAYEMGFTGHKKKLGRYLLLKSMMHFFLHNLLTSIIYFHLRDSNRF